MTTAEPLRSVRDRGTYRVLYRLREDPYEVIVLHIDHRRDVYRPR